MHFSMSLLNLIIHCFKICSNLCLLCDFLTSRLQIQCVDLSDYVVQENDLGKFMSMCCECCFVNNFLDLVFDECKKYWAEVIRYEIVQF